MKGRNIEGCRVLVVEDEMLIALLIEDALVGLGCEIVGPVTVARYAFRPYASL
jgi:CheY-like chemotaxis protein